MFEKLKISDEDLSFVDELLDESNDGICYHLLRMEEVVKDTSCSDSRKTNFEKYHKFETAYSDVSTLIVEDRVSYPIIVAGDSRNINNYSVIHGGNKGFSRNNFLFDAASVIAAHDFDHFVFFTPSTFCGTDKGILIEHEIPSIVMEVNSDVHLVSAFYVSKDSLSFDCFNTEGTELYVKDGKLDFPALMQVWDYVSLIKNISPPRFSPHYHLGSLSSKFYSQPDWSREEVCYF